MRYSKNNIQLLLAKLKVFGVGEPSYYVFNKSSKSGKGGDWVPYTQLDAATRKRAWPGFRAYVETEVQKCTHTSLK